jgi:hypothetical protein
MASTTFTKLCDFPPELRYMIWEEAFFETPKSITVRFEIKRDWLTIDGLAWRMVDCASPPAVLYACKESRDATIKLWHRLRCTVGKDSNMSYIYFDPVTTVLEVELIMEDIVTCPRWPGFFYNVGSALQVVRHLHVRCCLQRLFGEWYTVPCPFSPVASYAGRGITIEAFGDLGELRVFSASKYAVDDLDNCAGLLDQHELTTISEDPIDNADPETVWDSKAYVTYQQRAEPSGDAPTWKERIVMVNPEEKSLSGCEG